MKYYSKILIDQRTCYALWVQSDSLEQEKRAESVRKGYCDDKIIDSILEIDQANNIECYELEGK